MEPLLACFQLDDDCRWGRVADRRLPAGSEAAARSAVPMIADPEWRAQSIKKARVSDRRPAPSSVTKS